MSRVFLSSVLLVACSVAPRRIEDRPVNVEKYLDWLATVHAGDVLKHNPHHRVRYLYWANGYWKQRLVGQKNTGEELFSYLVTVDRDESNRATFRLRLASVEPTRDNAHVEDWILQATDGGFAVLASRSHDD